jgi:Cu+-exporting ATPase
MIERNYLVRGMTCSACAAHVKKAVSRLDGVETSEVNIATEKLNVKYNEEKQNFETLKAAVENAGYGLAEERQTKKTELLIEGMSCAACSAAVERVTRKLNGVISAQVNLTTNRGSFEYDPSKVKLSEIKGAIEKAGYKPSEIAGEKSRDIEAERRRREALNMRIRLIVAAVFSLPVLYIAMSHMFPKLGIPIPYFMGSHDFPFIFALVQLGLTVPVVIAGSRFYTKGLKTLVKGAPNMDTLIAVGTGSAFLYSVFATVKIYLGDFAFAQSLYFESAAVVITLVMLGKYLEAASRGKTSEAIKKLMQLKPTTATVYKIGRASCRERV